MESFYFYGVFASFLFSMTKVSLYFSMRFSLKAKNLAKINQCFHFSKGQFAAGPENFLLTSLYLSLRLFVFPFLSWVAALFDLIFFTGYWSQKISEPEKIKEISYTLCSFELSQKEILTLDREYVDFCMRVFSDKSSPS